jgi:YegS/Rv2252/BmrU family lipid kinase
MIKTDTEDSIQWQIIINPQAVKTPISKILSRLSHRLGATNISYRTHLSYSGEEGRRLASTLAQQGNRHFIAMGGDGTLNEVVNGLFLSGIDTTQLYLALFPAGTGNDWSRTHHYPKKWKRAIPSLHLEDFIKHDVGCVESKNGTEYSRRYFINIAGFGFDAAIIDRAGNKKKKLFSTAVYISTLLKVLFSHKSQPTAIKIDGTPLNEDIFSIAVGICQYNGNGMKQVPHADPTDGLLDIVLIRNIKARKVLANVGRLFKGKHLHLEEISVHQGAEVELCSTTDLLGEVEGEMLPTGSYKINIQKQALNILKPNVLR